MTERLEREHIEASEEVTAVEIARSIRILQMDMADPETSERKRKELDRRIGQLVFEYHFRKYKDLSPEFDNV